MAATPEIEILFFGKIADRLGRRRETQGLPAGGASLFAVRESLFGGEISDVRMSVNQIVMASDCALNAGDEVAFFSVFSGG